MMVKRKVLGSSEGLSLVEVIVAIFLIAVAIASTLPILYRMMRYTQAMRLKSKALYLAETQLDKIQSWPIYSNDTGMAEQWISLGNKSFWDYGLFDNPNALECPSNALYCKEYLRPRELGVIYERTTWIIRNGNDGPYDCAPLLFGSAPADFQGGAAADRVIDEGKIYLSNGSTFSSSPLTFVGIGGPAATASLNQWASYRWNNKRRLVRYDDSCGGSYPYRGEDFVLVQSKVSWHTRLGFGGGPIGGKTVKRSISRVSMVRGR